MSSSSSSSKNQSSVTNIREDYIFNNAGGGTSANVGQADSVVNTITTADPEVMRDALAAISATSQDAFSQAFGFGGTALDSMADTASNALTSNSDVMAQALDGLENQAFWSGQAIEQSLGTLKSIGTGGTSDAADAIAAGMKFIPLAAAVAVGLYAWSRK